jgi:hypothetical protein
MEIIEKYFQSTEGCSYDEFCNLYNNGQKLYGDLKFTKFPPEVIAALISTFPDILPERFKLFLIKHNVLQEYLNNFIQAGTARQHPRFFEVTSEKNWIGSAFSWPDQKWATLSNQWIAESDSQIIDYYFESVSIRTETYMPGRLADFLMRNGAYNRFINNLPVSAKDKYYFTPSKCKSLMQFFSWSKTREGDRYWRKLEEMYNLFIRNEKK